MSDNQDSQTAANDVVALVRGVRDVISETQSDYGQMPVFVRPMAKRGFVKRTGKSCPEWETYADDLAARVAGSAGATPEDVAQLKLLEDNYRTAPERAARFMRDPAALAGVKVHSEEREKAVRALIEALESA